jgi:hypothetical protein
LFFDGEVFMSKRKVLGLAAGALLLLGVQQIAGAATAAAQGNPAELSAATGGVDKAAYRGNIYGSQGVIGHTDAPQRTEAPRRGYYGASRIRHHYYAHRSYRGYAVSRRYYGAARYPRFYANRYYQARPAVADSYFGSTSYYPQYYSHRYYPTRPAAADSYFGSTASYSQYYSNRYYPTQPVGAALASTDLFAPTNWRAGCVNGMVCTGGYSYHRGVPICRGWAACNY